MMEDKETRRQEDKKTRRQNDGRQEDKETRRQEDRMMEDKKTRKQEDKTIVMASKSFREVMAWQKAHEFVLAFYKTKRYFPDDEKFALVPQFQRAAVSIAANIAEGYKKVSRADKLRFFNIAQGSLEECRYYIILSHDVGYYPQDVANDMWAKIEEAAITLHSYCEAIKANKGITDEQV